MSKFEKYMFNIREKKGENSFNDIGVGQYFLHST